MKTDLKQPILGLAKIKIDAVLSSPGRGGSYGPEPFEATLLGDNVGLCKLGEIKISSEESMILEMPGNFIVFLHSGIVLPEKVKDRTPVKTIHYLFYSGALGLIKVEAYLSCFNHESGIGSYRFMGNYLSIRSITEKEAELLFPDVITLGYIK
jgi:hypothetical protein